MRIFLAIELPEELKEKIFVFSKKIARGSNIKLVEKENLHLTLVFLGSISEDERKKVIEAIRKIEKTGEINLRLGRVEIFPDRKKPHGVWINVEGEKEKLFSLYKKIVEAILKAGVKLENRQLRFSPHITTGRFREKEGKKVPEGLMEIEGQEFTVKRVTLFESQLSSKGPKYGKLAEFEIK